MAKALAATAAALAAVALFLSGCGGGTTTTTTGPSPGPSPRPGACLNSKMDMKTQSFTGKMKMAMTMTMGPNKVAETGDGTLVEKLDRENLNERVDENLTMTMTMPDPSPPMKMTMVEKMFLSVTKKLAAVSQVTTINGNTTSKCSYVDLSKVKGFPPPAEIKAGIDAMIAALAKKMPCTGSDGTYDTFTIDIKIPDPSIPIKFPGTGEVKEQMQMDKNLMMHAMTMTMDMDTPANGSVPAQKMHMDMNATVDDDGTGHAVAKPQGPTDSDLDYSSWGKCTEVPPPPSIKGFFKASRIEALNKVFKHRLHAVTSPSPFSGLLLTVVDEQLQKLRQPEFKVVV